MQKITVGKTIYRELPCCSVGDYGGSGSLGQSNINTLKEQFADRVWVQSSGAYCFEHETGYTPKQVYSSQQTWVDADVADWDGVDLIVVTSHDSSETAFLREDCEEYDDIVATLEKYPVLDGDELGKVEQQWADDAVLDLLRYDLPHKLSDEARERWEALTQEQRENIFWRAVENTGASAECEYSSAFWRLDDIAPTIEAELMASPIIRVFALADGTIISMGEPPVPEETPDQYGRMQADFDALPTCSTAEYIAAWDKARNYVSATAP